MLPEEFVIKKSMFWINVFQHFLGVHDGGSREQNQLKLTRGVA